MNEFRPYAWKCDLRGCFNEKHRLNFGVFYDCFPGKISMTDVDASVEVNGRFLFMEFKSRQIKISAGQRIYFDRLTRISTKISVIVVHADVEKMEIFSSYWIHNGVVSPWTPTNLLQLQNDVADWARWDMKSVT